MTTTRFALVGNPNAGKTTLFNALTGLKQRVGNYPGVTVERKSGEVVVDGTSIELVDLPGTYSLAALSPDEMIAVDLLCGRIPGEIPIRGLVAIVDASNLQRNCYLVSQLLELDLPLCIVLNMTDVAERKGIRIDAARLGRQLGVPVIPTCANAGIGLDAVRQALATLATLPPPRNRTTFPAAVETTFAALQTALDTAGEPVSRVEAQRLLIDTDGYATVRLMQRLPSFGVQLTALRQQASNGTTLAGIEAATRYQWIRERLRDVVQRPATPVVTWSDRADRVLTHKVYGSLIFAAVTLCMFQSIYTWATPFMDWLDAGFGFLGTWLGRHLPAGALQSLLVDGVIKGVGSVLVFLPQIALLFFFIALLEDCGYMARAAFLMDKLFARIGLSGKSFIPMLSSFACAIPGIMATRTIENRRDRLATILVSPLMSCSARLPVYLIMIAAFIPAAPIMGRWLNLQGVTLFGMHLLGLLVAVPIVWVLKRTLLKGSTPPFVMELPSYKRPSLRLVAYRVYDRAKAFVRRAGTIIFAMSIVVWALAYFPHPAAIGARYAAQRTALLQKTSPVVSRQSSATVVTDDRRPTTDDDLLLQLDHAEAAEYLGASAFGQIGRLIEPAVRPLGWDWRIGLAALASFPAREVIVAVLGTIYNLGAAVDADSPGLQRSLQAATWPDGRAVFNIPVALSIMVFFALCCQCGATVATIRRETNSWGYAWFTFGYMTALAYVAALVTYQGAMWLGA